MSEATMTCCFVDGEGGLCGDEAEVYRNLPVCNDHREELRRSYRTNVQALAKQTLNFYTYEDFPGICYIILIPGGIVKIGYSNTEETYAGRLKKLTREHGPLVELLRLPGGFVTEAHLHSLFSNDRLPGNGELFRYSEDIASFIRERTT